MTIFITVYFKDLGKSQLFKMWGALLSNGLFKYVIKLKEACV